MKAITTALALLLAAMAHAAEPCSGWIQISEKWSGTVGEFCQQQGKDCRAVEGRRSDRSVTTLQPDYAQYLL